VSLKAQLNQNIKKVEDFQVEVIEPNIKCETSFEIIKEGKYVSRRESAEIAMEQYARGSERFFSALSILTIKT